MIRSILQELVVTTGTNTNTASASNSNEESTTTTNNSIFNWNSNSFKATIDTAFDIHDRATTASRIGRVRQIVDLNSLSK